MPGEWRPLSLRDAGALCPDPAVRADFRPFRHASMRIRLPRVSRHDGPDPMRDSHGPRRQFVGRW